MTSCFHEKVDFYDRCYKNFASATRRKMVSQMKTYMRQLQYADQFHWVRPVLQFYIAMFNTNFQRSGQVFIFIYSDLHKQ